MMVMYIDGLDDDGDGINNAWENDNDTSDEKKQ